MECSAILGKHSPKGVRPVGALLIGSTISVLWGWNEILPPTGMLLHQLTVYPIPVVVYQGTVGILLYVF